MTEESKVPPEAEHKADEPKVDAVEKLQSEIDAMKKRQDDQDRTINRKERENRRLSDLLQNRDDTADISKAALAALATQTGRSEDDIEALVRGNQPDLVKQFETIIDNSKKKREQDEYSKSATELEKRVTALGYGRGTPEHYEIFGRLAMGDTDGAYSRLEELEQAKGPKQETKVEDVEAKIEEEVRKRMEAQGLLTTETAVPAGTLTGAPAYSREDVQNMDSGEFQKLFPGGMEDFLAKASRGEIVLKD